MRRASVIGTAALLTVVLWVAQLAASSPAFHHWLHHDVSGTPHECAAVLLQQGLIEGPLPEVAPPLPPQLELTIRSKPQTVIPTSPRELPPGRAPPHA